MKEIILYNDGCKFTLKSGKTIFLKGNYTKDYLSDEDFNNLLSEYPVLRVWEEKGFLTFSDEKLDNKKADDILNAENAEKERTKEAEKQAKENIKKNKKSE